MNPLIETVAVVAILAVIVGGAYLKGAKDARLEAETERLAAIERAIDQAKEQARIDAEIIAAATERQADIQTRTRTITRTVTKHVEIPVYRECRLDDYGLCLAREAAAGRDGAACTGGADAALPAAGSADGRDDGRAAGVLRGNGHEAARL